MSKRPQQREFNRLENRGRSAAIKTAVMPGACDVSTPSHGSGLHLAKRRPGSTSPQRITHVRHWSFHTGFVFRFERPRRVNETAVMFSELGVATIDLRVIQVRAINPGLQIVRNETCRNTTKKLERRNMMG